MVQETKKRATRSKKKPSKVKSSTNLRRKKPGGRSLVLKWSLILSLWSTFLAGLLIIWFSYDLPSVRKLVETPRRPSITFFDRQGMRFATVGDYYGKPVDAACLPRHVVHAFLATEDRRFFNHFGVDLWGLGRALYHNFSAGGVVQGGSTITQQLAKNFLLTEGLYTYQDRSLRRKIQEVLLSLWLEYKFTKNQILTIYLNRVYFGSGAFGLAAAAKQYFNKSVQNLTLYEAAVLAGLLKAPSKYSPLKSPDQSSERTHQVLAVMVEAGYITPEAKAAAHGETQKGGVSSSGRYFVDWILDLLPSLVGEISEDLHITTTLDMPLQRVAEREVKRLLESHEHTYNAHQGAAITMTAQGAVRAIVGGKSYQDSQFNRAVQALRQPGSAYKLFVFLAAFEKGRSPSDTIADGPVRIGSWSPRNHGWQTRGEITLQDAFAHSVNTSAVRLIQYTGANAVNTLAKRLGISAPQPRDLTVALGSGQASLLEMTGSYATLATDGHRVRPYGVLTIKTRFGKTLYVGGRGPSERVLSPEVTAKIKQLASTVMDYGTGSQVKLSGIACGGKTGTTQNYRDSWFIGYAQGLVTGIWVGNDDNQPMKKGTGARLAGQIWHQIMINR